MQLEGRREYPPKHTDVEHISCDTYHTLYSLVTTAPGIYIAFLFGRADSIQLQENTFHSRIFGYGIFKVNFIIIS